MFADPWNPKADEILKWATSIDDCPEQDLDLSLATCGQDELLIELACQSSLQKHQFLIHILYFMVGDALHGRNKSRKDQLLNLIRGVNSEVPEIKKWKNESIAAIEHRTEFDYDYWCNHMAASSKRILNEE